MPVIREAFLSPSFDQSKERAAFTPSLPDTNLRKEKMAQGGKVYMCVCWGVWVCVCGGVGGGGGRLK